MNQKKIKVTIDTKGNWAIEAGEGFSGQSCVEQTKNLEIAIGGVSTEEGKTCAYYDPDDCNPLTINNK